LLSAATLKAFWFFIMATIMKSYAMPVVSRLLRLLSKIMLTVFQWINQPLHFYVPAMPNLEVQTTEQILDQCTYLGLTVLPNETHLIALLRYYLRRLKFELRWLIGADFPLTALVLHFKSGKAHFYRAQRHLRRVITADMKNGGVSTNEDSFARAIVKLNKAFRLRVGDSLLPAEVAEAVASSWFSAEEPSNTSIEFGPSSGSFSSNSIVFGPVSHHPRS
jgi:hypothetical protein